MFKRIFMSLAFVTTFAAAAIFGSVANADGHGHGHHGHGGHYGHDGHGHGHHGYHGYGGYYRPYFVGPPVVLRGSYYPAQYYGGYYPYYDPYYYSPGTSVIIGW